MRNIFLLVVTMLFAKIVHSRVLLIKTADNEDAGEGQTVEENENAKDYGESKHHKTCPPNKKEWKEDCNTCWCEDGKPWCTQQICPKEPHNHKTTPNTPIMDFGPADAGEGQTEEKNENAKDYGESKHHKTCPANKKEWKEDCNTCWCEDGKPWCTQQICPKEPHNHKPTPNTPIIDFGPADAGEGQTEEKNENAKDYG